ncbi:hypothetical protein ACFLWN_04535 [Chloroflexota bacterium]
MKPEPPFDYLTPLADEGRNNLWEEYHLSTRTKLEGATFFCRCVLGSGSMPRDIGGRDLYYKLLEWYLDAFFFELVSAYEVVFQELNILYSGETIIEEKDVKWTSVKEILTEDIVEYIDNTRNLTWFIKLRQHRNKSAHHSHIHTSSWSVGIGGMTWNHDSHDIMMSYFDPSSNELKLETIQKCRGYLNHMLGYVHEVWTIIANHFDVQNS